MNQKQTFFTRWNADFSTPSKRKFQVYSNFTFPAVWLWLLKNKIPKKSYVRKCPCKALETLFAVRVCSCVFDSRKWLCRLSVRLSDGFRREKNKKIPPNLSPIRIDWILTRRLPFASPALNRFESLPYYMPCLKQNIFIVNTPFSLVAIIFPVLVFSALILLRKQFQRLFLKRWFF